MLHLLLTYWPVLVLLYLPKLAQLASVVIATRTKSKLDHRIPDEMPMTAGEWLDTRLRALQLGVTAIVTDKHDDAYRPFEKLIQLHETTHFKADPVYWATAAHELGHARMRAEVPIVGRLRTISNYASVSLRGVGVALLVGYVLYAVPLAGTLAFSCFVTAAALRSFVLLDEACASVLAYRELRANDEIDFVHLRAIRAVLVTAFATYFVTYASYALLLTQWSLLATLAHPIDRLALTTLGWIAASVLSVASVAALLLDRGAVRWLPISLLVLLVWNVIDPAYAWCVILALAASWHVWHRMAHFPLALPYLYLSTWATAKLSGPGVEHTRRFWRARSRGEAAVANGNQRIDGIHASWQQHPSRYERIISLARLGYLPLLVAIWL